MTDGGLVPMVLQCAGAVLAGSRSVTLSVTGRKPLGFPRGELLSVGTNGSRNMAFDPIKVLAWVHARTSANPAMRHTHPLKG